MTRKNSKRKTMPPSARRGRGRPPLWTEKENRLLLALGERFPERGELRRHLESTNLTDRFPGKTLAALMIQSGRLKGKREVEVEQGSVTRVTRTRANGTRQDLGGIEGGAPGNSGSESDSTIEYTEDQNTDEEVCCGTDVRVVILNSSRPPVAKLHKNQDGTLQGLPTDGASHPVTYRAGSFMCKIDRPSPASPSPAPSSSIHNLPNQHGSSASRASHPSLVEMAGVSGRLSTAKILHCNAARYHQENLMKERELLYSISEAGDDIEAAEQRVQDARLRRENLRQELVEVQERVKVGSEMDKVLQRQLHHGDTR